MTASTEPRGGLDLGWSSGEDGWGDAMNANLLRLSRLGFHPSVLSATTTAPPGSPVSGSGYIIPSGATGAWAGKTGQVAVWDGSAWACAAPRDGWTMHVYGAGLTTYDNGIWSQANVVTASGIGAEPYAGVPAQASFWRSTAAGVRAWVQLVAADITDLATTLAGYLTKANPTYNGRLTGPTQYLEADEQILLAIRRPGGQSGRIHGVAFQAQTLDGTWREFGRALTYISSVTAGAHTGGMRLMAYKDGAILQALDAGPDGVTFAGLLSGPRATLTEFGTLRDRVGNPAFGALYAAGVTPATTNYVLAMTDAGTETYLGASDKVALVVGGTSKLTVDVGEMNLASGMALKMSGTTVIDSSRNITGATLKGGNITGTGNRPLVAGADGTIDDQDAATFRGTIGALAASLKGATNGVAELGADVKVPVAQLPSAALLALGADSTTAHRGDHGTTAYTHSQAAGNPHGTTAADVGALASANPNFTGNLLQDGVQRINPSGGGRFTDLSLATLAAGSDLPMVSDAAGVLRNKSAGAFRTIIAAAASDHNHFSKLEVSASTTIGSIDASAIKVTATDVNLTLSGGVDGQGWDIINPTTSTGFAIPSGATLWKSNGFDVGPTTIALGGGRPIRITRIDANTWTMLGSQ